MRTFLDYKLIKRKSSLSDLMLSGLICDKLKSGSPIETDYAFARLKLKTIQLRLTKEASQLVADFAEAKKLRLSEAGYCVLASILSENAEEAWYQLKLAAELNGKREVTVPCGRIDIITDQLVIEVKTAKQYKHAIGQVLCYQVYKPNRAPAIALFGKLSRDERSAVLKCCKKLGIQVLWL